MPFLKAYLWLHREWKDYPIILDTTHLFPEQIIELGWHTTYKVAFLGYPSATMEQKFKDIRNYADAKADWTANVSDDELKPMITIMIAFSQTLQAKCAEHNLPFFDTSNDFNSTLEQAHRFLTSN